MIEKSTTKRNIVLVTQLKWDLKTKLKIGIVSICIALIYLWSAHGTNLNFYELLHGLYGLGDIFSRMLPPDITATARFIQPIIETVQISIWGTTLAVLFSIPLGILAARNNAPNVFVYHLSRLLLNTLRAIPEVVFALIFVSAVGLGPFPGVIAIALHSTGMLGKFLAESIENVDPGPIEALRATGARKKQVLVYAIVPQIMPEFISLCLFRWEMNFRASTILGIVGAGGIGFELMTSMRLFQYREMTVIILLILLIVTLVDFIASSIRKRII
jgi:phosphonate transport system permease protein